MATVINSTSGKLRIALVGTGGYGERYLEELLRPTEALNGELVAAIDAWPERSALIQEVRDRGIPVYSDLGSFQKVDQADLVIISAPIHLHAPLACQALASGSHVLCEKPVSGGLHDAERMQKAEKAAGKIVAIGYQLCFSDAIQALKADILAGTLGEPVSMKTLVLWPRPLSYYHRNSWAGKLRTDDGMVINDSPLNNAHAHYFQNMLYLLGNSMDSSAYPQEVEAELSRANDIENFDSAALRVITREGIELRMYASHAVKDPIGPLVSMRFGEALVESAPGQPISARFNDGRLKIYGNPGEREFSKLYATIAAIQGSAPITCGIEAALPQALCIDRIQSFPVATTRRDLIRTETSNNDTQIWVEGLAEQFTARYRSDTF